MDTIDFAPATRAVAAVLDGIRDDQLADPTPCPDYTVADLLDHLERAVAGVHPARPPRSRSRWRQARRVDGSRLSPRLARPRSRRRSTALAEAWTDPAAYDGLTMAGPIEMPAEIAALVALDEVVVHGWDLARATGQPYAPDEAAVLACPGLRVELRGARPRPAPAPSARPCPSRTDAPALDRLAGATGRDPRLDALTDRADFVATEPLR